MTSRRIALLLTAIAISCASPPKPTPAVASRGTTPPATIPEVLESPPLAASDSPRPFPAIHELKLDNGLAVDVVPRNQYPVVEVRLVLRAGTLSDDQQPGRASLAADVLKAGGAGKSDARALARRIENLGTSLDIETLPDSTQFSLSVTTTSLDAAMRVLSDVILRPRFDAAEADNLKQRRVERARTELLSNPDWEASLILLRQLYGNHPYAHPEPLPSELEALRLSDCKSWYQTEVTPKNAVLLLVGDVRPERAFALAKSAFSSWRGARPSARAAADPKLPIYRKIWLIDRPGLAQSEIRVAGLGTTRKNPSWPSLVADNQIVGGATAGRLFLNVREQQSLAYHTGSVLLERTQGRVPIVLAAGTRAEKTAESLQALLQQASALTSTPPNAAEVEMATRYLSDRIAFQTETVAGIARLIAMLRVFDLPNSYYDQYTKQLLALKAPELFATTLQIVDFWSQAVVVVGDAGRIEQSLRKFGSVAVLNPKEELTMDHELSPL